jgi:hypothetical protein
MKKYFVIGICFMLSMIPVTVQARPHHGGRHHGGGELNGDFYKAMAWTSFGINTAVALKTLFSPSVVVSAPVPAYVQPAPVVSTTVYPAPYTATNITNYINPVVPVYAPYPPPVSYNGRPGYPPPRRHHHHHHGGHRGGGRHYRR